MRLGPWTPEYQPQGGVSEDCLYLNIWTAAKSSKEKRPVVMYIPGGAFTGGSGNVPCVQWRKPGKERIGCCYNKLPGRSDRVSCASGINKRI